MHLYMWMVSRQYICTHVYKGYYIHTHMSIYIYTYILYYLYRHVGSICIICIYFIVTYLLKPFMCLILQRFVNTDVIKLFSAYIKNYRDC